MAVSMKLIPKFAIVLICITFGCDPGETVNDSEEETVEEVPLKSDMSHPLTLETIEDGTITISNPLRLMINYSKNDSKWYSFTSDVSFSCSAGDKICIFGDNATYSVSLSKYTNIHCSSPCYIYGNIMSLVDSKGYESATKLEIEYAFNGLFKDNTNIVNHPDIPLLLPATTLASYCYYAMFEGCTGLTSAPELPATTLVQYCYASMFSGCSSLNYIKMMATDISATDCMKDWLSGVAESGLFERNPEATWVKWGDSGIPRGWAVIINGTITDYYERQPLTLEAIEDGTITISNPLGLNIYYAKQNDQWSSSSYKSITISYSAGDKISIFGNNSTYSSNRSTYTNIQCSSPCYIYGNIMSLVDSEGYESASKLEKEYAFYGLFKDNTNIVNHPDIPLLLPATTLSSYCYYAMFKGCSGLTSAPELPATTLAENCYVAMFSGCAGLTSAPELPATILARYCYNGMFARCTGLFAAPELPATTLAENCYVAMFSGCAGLTSAPELPATTLAVSCYLAMFAGCTGLISAPELPATSLAESCYTNMFYGCTGLTSAPELPAIILATRKNCYESMFEGCTGLSSAPELPATSLAEGCYSGMFKGCTGLTSAPELPATILAVNCYSSMFSDCTRLTVAPDLPAITLASFCYSGMFSGCSSLNYIKMLATNASVSAHMKDWVSGVATSGTFVKNADATWDEAAIVPTGWTVRSITM